MIPILALDDVEIQRRGTPTLDAAGRAVPSVAVSMTIRASVQSAPKTAHTWLPDALRGHRVVRVISYDEIRGITGTLPPDLVVADGQTYEVHTVDRLPGFLGQPPHWEAYAVSVSALEGAA